MLTAAVCDDNDNDAAKIMALVREWGNKRQDGEVRVRSFTSCYALLEAVSRGEAFDIFLLDILMPEMTGISLGEQLQSRLAEPVLIYLTSSEDYYPDAFRLYAFQYICKPVKADNLFPVLDRAVSLCEKRRSDVFILKTAEGTVQIPIHTIAYIELRSHICRLYLADGQCLQSLYLRCGFDSFAEPLLQRERFVKTHSAFAANLDFAGKLTPNALSLTTGAVVPVSRSFAAQVQRSYIDYGLRGEEGDVQ